MTIFFCLTWHLFFLQLILLEGLVFLRALNDLTDIPIALIISEAGNNNSDPSMIGPAKLIDVHQLYSQTIAHVIALRSTSFITKNVLIFIVKKSK